MARKQELVTLLHNKSGLKREVLRDVLDDLSESIIEILAEGDELHLQGFGKFQVKDGHVEFNESPRLDEKLKTHQ